MTASGDPPWGPSLGRLVSVPTRRLRTAPRAVDVEGVDVEGEPCRVTVREAGHRWLLVFLGMRCDGCLPFWPALSRPGTLGLTGDDRVAAVTRPAPTEDPAALRALAPVGHAPLVLSGEAWRAYKVQGPPFFVLVDGGRVVTEGVAWSVEYVAAQVRRVRGDATTRGAGD